jgi:hypothetical protein
MAVWYPLCQCWSKRIPRPGFPDETRRSGGRSATSSSITRAAMASSGSRYANCARRCASALLHSRMRAKTRGVSLNAVVAMAEAMGESPMQVLVDLLVEAGTKKKNKQKKRGTQLQRPKNSSLR